LIQQLLYALLVNELNLLRKDASSDNLKGYLWS